MNYSKTELLVRRYLYIKRRLIDAGWADEIDWQADLDFAAVSESDFLRETAWVILSAGMAERVVQLKFPGLSRAFGDWHQAKAIVANRRSIRRTALGMFNHTGKIDAIFEVAQMVAEDGLDHIKELIASEREAFLQTLPYVGPVTALHLAKNLGLDVAKPDRHLVRIAQITGHESAASLCSDIADAVGDRVSVVDLVLWRFATQERRYRDYFWDVACGEA